ncbi:hypothetical protein L291_1890 [Acinetobacter guillouiae MSP4-18]|nr:hypothetical protein L291_1890 [Acinetobacter guillouiae MSP4-18]
MKLKNMVCGIFYLNINILILILSAQRTEKFYFMYSFKRS